MTDVDAGQLAEIVRRDAEYGTVLPDRAVAVSLHRELHMARDRRVLLGLLREARAAIGGFVWLGNNLHNFAADEGARSQFREFYAAASEDARAVLDTLAALERTPDER